MNLKPLNSIDEFEYVAGWQAPDRLIVDGKTTKVLESGLDICWAATKKMLSGFQLTAFGT